MRPKTPTRRAETPGIRARKVVLEALQWRGPTANADLRDDLAVRCGSKERVSQAISALSRQGLIEKAGQRFGDTVWKERPASLTDACERQGGSSGARPDHATAGPAVQ